MIKPSVAERPSTSRVPVPARRVVELRECLWDASLEGMQFLNGIVSEFPGAISFAPARPLDTLFGIEEHVAAVGKVVTAWAQDTGHSPAGIWRDLGQYSRTNGITAGVVADVLARDEQIHVAPDAIVVTVGAQEAMAIVLAGLFEPARDVLLVSDPTYVGITGLARLFGVRVVPVAVDEHGLVPEAVERAIVETSREGRVRALYDVPDFSNPLGTSLPLARRLALLEICRTHEVLIIEDNPYGMFRYEGERLPALKALDPDASVLYIGSFSKTLFPGLRMGYLVADQQVAPRGGSLAATLARVKNLISINTSPLSQAIVAGALLQSGGSLEPIVAPKRAQYKRHRDAMGAALSHHFADLRDEVSWSLPDGGFFLPMSLPFEFGPAELRRCAVDYGVIVTPMRFFCVTPSRTTQVRLAFSCVTPDDIWRGVERLARFVRAMDRSPLIAQRNDTQGLHDGRHVSDSCLAGELDVR